MAADFILTGNLLVVVVMYVRRLGARATSSYLGSAVILEFSDRHRRAPVLNLKVVGWQSCIT